MKTKASLILAALLALGTMASANAAIVVDVNDRPYYMHGPGYYVGPRYYVWVPGHWVRRHHHRQWVHGYYALR